MWNDGEDGARKVRKRKMKNEVKNNALEATAHKRRQMWIFSCKNKDDYMKFSQLWNIIYKFVAITFEQVK